MRTNALYSMFALRSSSTGILLANRYASLLKITTPISMFRQGQVFRMEYNADVPSLDISVNGTHLVKVRTRFFCSFILFFCFENLLNGFFLQVPKHVLAPLKGLTVSPAVSSYGKTDRF